MKTLEEQQALVSALAVSAARALWNQGRKLQRAWATERTRAQLHALNDRTLRDIGLTRSEIDSLLR